MKTEMALAESERKRGLSASSMRAFACKDCQREVDKLDAQLTKLEATGATKRQVAEARKKLAARREKSTYNENWARSLVDRGGSRSDRCKEHRQQHRTNTQGLTVKYIDLATVGDVADRTHPTGPLGGLGPLPEAHEIVPNTSYDLQEVRVGMTDAHVLEMIRLLREKQVLILKAGTGTGKSTFAPYRLMDPPPESLQDIPVGAPFAKLTDLGPIIVTEPRVQAAVGVASFVGGTMSGAGGLGPGYPVGYQVSGDRNHDEACELIYVTDGTMINWLREGRLSRIGTVIVDEAHERSTNIDFVMGYLKRELPRYPHLRVIITSATFNTDFYREYFGGDTVANVLEVPAEKAFGYGMPLFGHLDAPEDGEEDILERWTDEALTLTRQWPRDESDFIRAHWKTQFAEPLRYPDEVVYEADDERDTSGEDVWETTRRLLPLRYEGKVPTDEWKQKMPDELTRFVVRLAKGLDEADIFGDILGFLPTKKTIEKVCEDIERQLGRSYRDQVFPLVSSLPKDRQRKALAKRRKGDPRKIVISTNLAETSLTVEGVRFVVDTGVIAQSEWDPDLAKGGIPTKPHSQAGIKQRWGRVGRKAPGWVFPLYTKGQYLELAEDTPPGSTRENLESLVMTAKMGGIDDAQHFEWPAAFEPQTVTLDKAAHEARQVFVRELARADDALQAGGAVDDDGDPTLFGKELVRFRGLGSATSALALMYADRLACVPEVATVLALLEDTRIIGKSGLLLDDYEWPDEWRLEAAERHRGLASLSDDDAELVLLLAAAWERADTVAPWQDSEARRKWCRLWWVNHAVLLDAAIKRQEVLSALSPAMKEEVKRFLEPALIDRTRGALTRALASQTFVLASEGLYRPVETRSVPAAQPTNGGATKAPTDAQRTASQALFALEEDALTRPTGQVIAFRRREAKNDNRISSIVVAQPWALPARAQTDDDRGATNGIAEMMRIVIQAARDARPDPSKTAALMLLERWPVGQRVRVDLVTEHDGTIHLGEVLGVRSPFSRPPSNDERVVRKHGRGKGRPTAHAFPLDDEEVQATREDSSGELPLDRRQGFDDERTERERDAVADSAADDVLACGQCFSCVADRPEACDAPVRATPEGRRENPVLRWHNQTAAAADAGVPVVELTGADADSDGWYEVAGYGRRNGGFYVLLRPDWRRGQQLNAAQHPDLQAGDPVTVRIGEHLRHHGGALRAFYRADGKGRFIVAEASHFRADVQERRREIASALDRTTTDLLAGLATGAVVKATVVPAREKDTKTITLLELLHQHWAKGKVGPAGENKVLDPKRRNTSTKRLYSAVIEKPADENGYVTARLLLQDSRIGVVHRFRYKVPEEADSKRDRGSEATDDSGPAPEQAALTGGAPVLLNLVSDRASLDVAGLDLERLEKIEGESDGQLELVGLTTDGQRLRRASDVPRVWTSQTAPAGSAGASTEDAPEDDDFSAAPPGAKVMARTAEPLSRNAAKELVAAVDTDDDASWPNEVWAFWARTHHLTVDSRTPFMAGTRTQPVEVPAEVTVVEGTPLEQKRARLAAFAAAHPAFSVVECVVRATRNNDVIVDLGNGLEGLIPLDELSWRNRVAHPSQVHEAGDRLHALITELPEPPAVPKLSVRMLSKDPLLTFRDQHPVGSRVFGRVAKLIDSRAFLDLGNDVDGMIHISNLAHRRVENPTEVLADGDEVEAEILSFDFDRRQVELSRKALIATPYEEYKGSHQVGDVVHATVTSHSKSKSHVFLGLSNGATGMIYVANIAHGRVDDPVILLPVGTLLKAQIIEFDDEHHRVELSRKAMLPDPFEAFRVTHGENQIVSGVVTRLLPKSAFVDLGGGASGSIFIRDVTGYQLATFDGHLSEGQRYDFRIIGFDPVRKQVKLARYGLSSQGGQSAIRSPGVATQVVHSPREQPVAPPSRREPRSTIAEGRSEAEAIEAACRSLNLQEYQVRVEVLVRLQKGLFGRIKQLARVRVTART